MELPTLERFLDKVASVVKSRSAYITTCTFETMGFNLHLIPILTVDSDSDCFHVGVERHGLESTEHHVVKTDITAELSDRSLNV